MLLAVSAFKLLAEVALLSLIGRGVLGLWLSRLDPARAAANPFWWLLHTLSAPPLWLAARLLPRTLPARYHPWLALALMLGLWVLATALKIGWCLDAGVAACR
jgi:hypothetical protein